MQVECSYYAALPAPPHTPVTIRIYAREIEIFDEQGQVLRRHDKSDRKGQYVLAEIDRLFVVTPLLDRLMHHAHLLKFEGKSWRLKEAATRVAKRSKSDLGSAGHRSV